MNFLTVIWGILIFAMACLPCMDKEEVLAPDATATVQADNYHHDGAAGEDLCSPLCECNCCGGISLTFQVPALSEPQQGPQSPCLSIYVSAGAASPSFSFWHPPKA
ncbi:DUF6660 family protein [Pontibacter actiniarum]|uniref:Uncharacterized protein n=1 Tax=Pontibacter actiniarum TaxID=323450 RepID=A0A1X9YNZ6_9BACT|nr:DUF6660 family protein [Pontibacter actiniarum]ARS34618.1 hypothetical protein CA264_03680 [Pontibacter actiniarum]